jgi:hypothetical protein
MYTESQIYFETSDLNSLGILGVPHKVSDNLRCYYTSKCEQKRYINMSAILSKNGVSTCLPF